MFKTRKLPIGTPSTADIHSTAFRSLRSPFPYGDGFAARIRLMRLSAMGNSKKPSPQGKGGPQWSENVVKRNVRGGRGTVWTLFRHNRIIHPV